MADMGVAGRKAWDLADAASRKDDRQDLVAAIGQGLSAVALALLDVADAIRTATTQHR